MARPEVGKRRTDGLQELIERIFLFQARSPSVFLIGLAFQELDVSAPKTRRRIARELQVIETIFSVSRSPDVLEPARSGVEPQSFAL
jgi:hypothetical protein